MPLQLGQILGLASSIPGMALGGYQLYKAGRIDDTRPEYQIPADVKAMLGIATSQASQNGLPGQDLMEQQISASTSRGANLLERTTQGATQLGGITDLVASEQANLANLGIAGAQNKQQSLEGLKSALMSSAQYKDKAFQMNEYEPYLRALEMKNNLLNSGIQNITGGAASGVSNWMTSDLMSNQMDYWQSLLNRTTGKDKKNVIDVVTGEQTYN